MTKIVALLPIKANSERVKGKNFRELAGKPLFQWILDALLSNSDIDQVVINTDAKDILVENGLKESERVVIRERKPELCGDLVSMNLILADDIEAVPADIYLMTHTTNPLITQNTIKKAIQTFATQKEFDSLFSVNKIQTRFYRADVSPVNHDPDNLIRTQDLEPWFEENSCLFLFTEQSFTKTNARIGKKPMMYLTPALESIDIDEPEDWELASALAERIVNNNKGI
ncbi:acylneuraminate cytidylyltransferase family protein [Pseudoalteromonas sp. JC28]|uniref:acylneuraminate cytidylyltransferase family protein n=1 Tax=Pseudoalteromonas sp. JC28 TaxID=2267617 RepID=UPI0015748524|nr:acylneuraminate cytidylyltransferase family protein [Pseudoalteromonas sp. JC28]NSY35202.1 acylneuraminate cytidylyltransferase family protein [Pseudoalteromonas sp. JC28]